MLDDAGIKDSFWGKRIMASFENGNIFTADDIEKSNVWVTCACGRLTDDIYTDDDGKPYDKKLENLGYKFYSEILIHNQLSATKTLVRIEERARFLGQN